jgi:hypothetical protein
VLRACHTRHSTREQYNKNDKTMFRFASGEKEATKNRKKIKEENVHISNVNDERLQSTYLPDEGIDICVSSVLLGERSDLVWHAGDKHTRINLSRERASAMRGKTLLFFPAISGHIAPASNRQGNEHMLQVTNAILQVLSHATKRKERWMCGA